MKHTTRTVLELGVGLGFLLTVVLTLALGGRARVEARVCADTVRLHVLANSDTVEDQLLKLEVRDAILAALPPSVTAAQDPGQALQALGRALPVLQRAADAVLLRSHSGQRAVLRLETLDFAPRDYGDFALPGGTYRALRVELGEARGHNWFCVLYPALCVSGAAARYPTAAENALVFGRYEVRSALLDALLGR